MENVGTLCGWVYPKSQTAMYIWVFPKIMIPPNHPIFSAFPWFSPSILFFLFPLFSDCHPKSGYTGKTSRGIFTLTGGATSLKEELVERVPVLRDAGSFREARRIFREVNRSVWGVGLGGQVEILLRSDVDWWDVYINCSWTMLYYVDLVESIGIEGCNRSRGWWRGQFCRDLEQNSHRNWGVSMGLLGIWFSSDSLEEGIMGCQKCTLRAPRMPHPLWSIP